MSTGGRNTRNNNGRNNNNNNNDGGNVLNQLAQTLATLVGNQQPAQRSIVSEFKRLSPTFDGATDPAVVEKWIQEMEKAFELMGSTDAQKVTLAAYQLQGSAYD